MRAESVELIKKEFSHLDSIFFNTAYFGPSPYRAKQKVMRAVQRELDPSFYGYDTWIGIPDRMRRQLAELVGCSTENIAHHCSVSDFNNIVANGLDFKKGDVMASIDRDYPSNVIPYMLKAKRDPDVEFKLLELGDQNVPTGKWLAENLPKKTRVFCMSWVTFDTGKKMDLIDIGKVLKERDILFVVDATQGLGGLSITQEELDHIDILACSSYKWILGPYGHAFAYFSDNALKKIHHTTGNWVTSPNSKIVYNLLDYTTETLPGARKYDRGQTPNMLTMSCLEAGLELYKEIGLEEVQKYNSELRDYFLDIYPKKKFSLITPKDYMGNILALKSKGVDPIDLERELKQRNVDVSVRQGNVRLSFHLFNSKEQVEKLVEALDL